MPVRKKAHLPLEAVSALTVLTMCCHAQVRDTRGSPEEFFQNPSVLGTPFVVSVHGNTVLELRLIGGDATSLLLPGTGIRLDLLEGSLAQLVEVESGQAVQGSVRVVVMGSGANLPKPRIETWGIMGAACYEGGTSSGQSSDGRVTALFEEHIPWSGLTWSIITAPSNIKDDLAEYLAAVNLRKVGTRDVTVAHVWASRRAEFSPKPVGCLISGYCI